MSHKQISFRSLRNYSAVTYEEALKKVKFSNYENFVNINEAYSNSIRDKLFKKFKKSRLPLDEENYKKARYEVKKLIAKRKEKLL